MKTYLQLISINVSACIELQYVQEVLHLVYLDPLPGSISSLVGMMNISGTSVPVLDLGMYLGLDRETKYSLQAPIVLLSKLDKTMGLIVDKVSGLTNIDDNMLSNNVPNNDDGRYTDIVNIDNQSSLLINIDKLLNTEFIVRNNHG
jgi:chemotaxis signal transduction protein